MEISEQRRLQLVALSMEESWLGDDPPLHAPDTVEEKPVKVNRAGRPKIYIRQRMCKCGNLARAKLRTKDIIYWDGKCNQCHYKKYKRLVKRPVKKAFKQEIHKYIPSLKAWVPRRAKCTLQ